MSSRAFPLWRYKQRKLLSVTMTQKVIFSSLIHWGCIMIYNWSHYSLYFSPFHLYHYTQNVHVMSICHIPSCLCVLNVHAACWLHFITWLLHECPTFAPIKLISFVEENSISRLQCQILWLHSMTSKMVILSLFSANYDFKWCWWDIQRIRCD